MNKNTGRALEGRAHLKQRIADILTTPLGTRVERRDYGSRLPRLVDKPVNPSLKIDLVHATADALARWEPEFKLDIVRLDFSKAGHAHLDIEGTELLTGEAVKLERITI